MLRRLFLAAWVLLVLAVPPLAQADIRSPSAVTVAAKADDALVLAIQEAKADIDNTDLKHAMQVLKTVRKRQDFEAAASPLRHGVILMIAGLAADAEDWPAATEAIVVASEMPDAVAVDWTLRLDIAGPTDAPEEALRSLTVLAQRFPTEFDALSDGKLYYWRHRARSLPDGQARLFALTDAMERAGLAPDDVFTDLSALWSEYALGLLSNGRLAEAQAVAGRITDPDEPSTLPKRTMQNVVCVANRAAAA